MILKFGSLLIVIILTMIILGYFIVKTIKPIKLSDSDKERILTEFFNNLPG